MIVIVVVVVVVVVVSMASKMGNVNGNKHASNANENNLSDDKPLHLRSEWPLNL